MKASDVKDAYQMETSKTFKCFIMMVEMEHYLSIWANEQLFHNILKGHVLQHCEKLMRYNHEDKA